MRIKDPIMAIDARGAFGPGTVMAKTRGTNWARIRIRTPQKMSSAETIVKNNLAKAARNWHTLLEEERESWRVYALTITRYNSMGDPYQVSGACEYYGCHSLSGLMGITAGDSAPLSPLPSGVIGLEVQVQPPPGTAFRLRWTYWWGAHWVEIFISPGKAWSQKYYNNQVRLNAFRKQPVEMYTAWVEGAGMAWAWAIRYVSDAGQGGPWSTGVVQVSG